MTNSNTHLVKTAVKKQSRGARIWEAGWIGSPTRGAACLRGIVVLVFTFSVIAAIAVQWCHSTYAGAWAFFDVLPAVVGTILAMVALLYWLHGSIGQCFLFFTAAMLSALLGGIALSNAVFTARGVVSSATITDYADHTDIRTTYSGCHVTLQNGTRVARPVRCDGPRIGQRVTVTIDPDGLASPAFGDRAKENPVILWIEGTALALTAGTIVAATWTGERLRLKGEPSAAEAPNPQYYPRRRTSPEYGIRPSAPRPVKRPSGAYWTTWRRVLVIFFCLSAVGLFAGSQWLYAIDTASKYTNVSIAMGLVSFVCALLAFVPLLWPIRWRGVDGSQWKLRQLRLAWSTVVKPSSAFDLMPGGGNDPISAILAIPGVAVFAVLTALWLVELVPRIALTPVAAVLRLTGVVPYRLELWKNAGLVSSHRPVGYGELRRIRTNLAADSSAAG